MASPPTIDCGDRLPLRYSFRPQLGSLPYMLLLAVLFGVLPIAYLASQGGPYPLSRIWLPLVLVPVGAIGLLLAAVCVRSRVGWRVDDAQVEMWVQGLLRRTVDRVPRSEYVALVTPPGEQPGFIGSRRRYQVILWHRDEAIRQVILYAGPSETRFRERLESYRLLFGLPVNPPELELVEMPDWMLDALARREVR